MPDAERAFYQGYSWCLNCYPTVGEAIAHLNDELARWEAVRPDWQVREVMTNISLLSCALLHAVDEYLRGTTCKWPRQAPRVPFSRQALAAVEKLAALLRLPRRARARRWKEHWQPDFDAFLTLLVADEAPAPEARTVTARALAARLVTPLPADLLAQPIYIPSAYRKHDLTHHDVLTLGKHFVARFPDRGQAILIVGLRTAGSYFAPVLRAFLRAEGYATVDAVTLRPDRGPGGWERADLVRCARGAYLAALVDDSPGTGSTIAQGVDIIRKAGFARDRVAVLAPAHPASRDWQGQLASLSLADTAVVTLEPEEWHKSRLLEPRTVERHLAEYFPGPHFTRVSVTAGPAAARFNAQLQAAAVDARRTRLKRVYEVRLETTEGGAETRHVLVKSVGWGWLGYHAFLIGDRLAGFVPSVLGLRDGLLYSEWLPQSPGVPSPGEDRERWVATAASYVAARARTLVLAGNPLPGLGLHQHHDGFGLLDRILSKAHGGRLAAGLMRPRVRQRLAGEPCPRPTLIDGKMQPAEWIAGPDGLLKTDYEHHGLGKNELNVLDPAYDLAEVILHLALSPDEEERLLRRYAAESGDADVGRRLFLNKLMAGHWAMASALKNLFRHPQLTHRQQEFHRDFLRAWNFLTVHAARQGGSLCRRPETIRWAAPLVVLDVDGVLDRRVFGFPCTTAAGIHALSLLHTHGFAVALDTARAAGVVEEYCRAYGLVGGVAEHGSYVWDAVAGRGRALVSPEALRQLDAARDALERLPGVFVDPAYQYSIRACTYEDRAPATSRAQTPYALSSLRTFTGDDKGSVPVPTLTVQHLMESLGLDRLCFHQTGSDTTIRARAVDKGTGLTALLDWAGQPGLETVAVGDSEQDLPMFRVATRCFAPAQVSGGGLARLLGCRVVRQPFQRGLLAIARALVHPEGGHCPHCAASADWPAGPDLVLDLLRAADRNRATVVLRALLDPATYRLFMH